MDHPCGPGPWTTSVDLVNGPPDGPPLIFFSFCQYKGWTADWGQGNKKTVLSLNKYGVQHQY